MISRSDYIKLIRLDHLISALSLYFIGVALSYKLLGSVSINSLIGAFSLFFAYASVYILNDLTDFEEDKKHYIKYKREQPLPSGRVSVRQASIVFSINALLGYFIALFTNYEFLIIITALTLLNYFYSITKLKKHFITSMTVLGVIQLLKLLLGWFSNTSNTNLIPLLLMLSIVFSYLFAISYYKKQRYANKHYYKFYQITTKLLALTAYFITIIINPLLRNSLIIFIIIYLFVFMLLYWHNKTRELDKSFTLNLFLLPLIINLFSALIILA